MKLTIRLFLAAGLLALFVGVEARAITKNQHQVHFQNIQVLDTNAKLKDLELRYNNLNLQLDNALRDKNTSQQQIQQLEDEKQQLEQQKQDLQQRVEARQQAKLAAQTRLNAAITFSSTASAESALGDSEMIAKAYIYQHESGNNPSAINSIGCRGLGQACPGSKLPCGNDYACQDAWFTAYCMDRYGSWKAAQAFWIGHSYW